MYSPRAIGKAQEKSNDVITLKNFIDKLKKDIITMCRTHIPFYDHLQDPESAMAAAPELVGPYLEATEKLQPVITLQKQRIKTLEALLKGEVLEKPLIDHVKELLTQNKIPTDVIDRVLEGNTAKLFPVTNAPRCGR